MNSVVLILLAIVIFVAAYLTYGRYLAKTWGIDPSRKTPAHELEDGVDYCPAKTPVLMGHHFSSIAGAGPINGPIQAAFFGWLPCFLWIVIGGIFFGAVQDFGSIFVSIRHEGKSLGEQRLRISWRTPLREATQTVPLRRLLCCSFRLQLHLVSSYTGRIPRWQWHP